MIVFAHNERMETQNLIGGAWLAANYGIEPVMPFQTVNRIGGNDSARHTWRLLDLTRHVTYLAHMLDRTIREDIIPPLPSYTRIGSDTCG